MRLSFLQARLRSVCLSAALSRCSFTRLCAASPPSQCLSTPFNRLRQFSVCACLAISLSNDMHPGHLAVNPRLRSVVVVVCCLLLFVVVCCCLLLFVVVCCCLLLFVVVCCCLLLFVVVVSCGCVVCVVVVSCGCGFGLRRTTLPQTTLPPDRPKFRSFFSPPATISILSSLLEGPFVEILGCFLNGQDPEMYTFGLSGCCVKHRRLRGRWGFTQQPDNSKRAHLTALALPNTTKKPREDTQ